ncbi:tRNA 5-methylaminomethyl-2-thiouridine biosynthesis bifunctional protein MnmC [compost metagenome]
MNQGKWIIPLGNQRVRLGATYSWHELDFEPTLKGREELIQAAEMILKKPFTFTGQQAGVRPATKDRRPFLGKHPQHNRLWIFNGLGTKGVSLAPWFAVQLVRNMLHDELIHPEANIERFYALYS